MQFSGRNKTSLPLLCCWLLLIDRRLLMKFLHILGTFLSLMLLCFPIRAAEVPVVPAVSSSTNKVGLPSVLLSTPSILITSAGNIIKINGLNLTNATEVRFLNSNAPGRLAIKSRGMLPAGQDTNKLGDSHLELELSTVPQAPAGNNSYVVVSPGGQSKPAPIMIFPADAIYAEKEPNGGFSDGQDLPFYRVIEGLINLPKDLDVYRVTGLAGQAVQIQVVASVLGSPVDSLISFYNSKAQVLASNDNSSTGLDSMVEAVLPADGAYYITVVDAKEGGGPAYAYYLLLTTP